MTFFICQDEQKIQQLLRVNAKQVFYTQFISLSKRIHITYRLQTRIQVTFKVGIVRILEMFFCNAQKSSQKKSVFPTTYI